MLSLVTLIADFLPIIAIAGVAFTSLYDLIIALAGHSENTKGVLTHTVISIMKSNRLDLQWEFDDESTQDICQ